MLCYLIFSYSIFGLISLVKPVSIFLNWSIYFIFCLNNKDRDPVSYLLGVFLAAHSFYCLYYFYSGEFYLDCVSQDNSQDNGLTTITQEVPKISSNEKIDLKVEEKPLLYADKMLLFSWFAVTVSLFLIANQMAN